MDKVLERLLKERFGFVVESCEKFGEHNNNTNLLLSSSSGQIFTKVMGSETVDGCRFELDILSILQKASTSIAIIKPLSRDPLAIDGVPAGVYEAIKGKQVSRKDIDLDLLNRVSETQLHIHEALSHIEGSPRTRFLPNDLSFVGLFGMNDDALAKSSLAILQGQLEELVFDEETKTIIHDDISMENILRCDNDLYLIDFSDAHYSYRISDIANAIKELVIDNYGLDSNFIERYIDSYNDRAKKPLRDQELASLPYLYARRALFMYCYYGSKSEDDTMNNLKRRQMNTLELLMGT